MKIDKKDIRKWVKALRSGKYSQTKEVLENKEGYCCLGVACDIFIEKKYINKGTLGVIVGVLPNDQELSPEWLNGINDDFHDLTELYLTNLNDTLNYTFDEIADCLELVYIHEAL